MAAHNRRRTEAEETRERSSSEEEEEESTEENEDPAEESDTESEGDKNNPPPPKKQLSSLPHHSSSDDDTESDSEIDLQSNPIRKSVPEVKPVSSKPMGEPLQASKKQQPRSKSVTDVQPSGGSSKRPAASPAPKKGKDSKRAKNEKNEKDAVEYENLKSTGDDPKKQLFQRLWSEDDEIAILKGMIDHGEKQGIDPASADMSSFYDFIRKSLHIDASKSQLTEKIRRLKKKYQTNLKKSKNDGDRTFSKAHDQTGYDLSKKIWGTESNGSYSAAKVSKKGKNVDAKAKNANLGSPNLERNLVIDNATGQKNVDMEVDQAAAAAASVVAAATPFSSEAFYRQAVDSSLEKEIMKYGSQLITGAKKVELDNKLKQLHMKEMEVYLQRLDYIREQTALVLENLKSSTN